MRKELTELMEEFKKAAEDQLNKSVGDLPGLKDVPKHQRPYMRALYSAFRAIDQQKKIIDLLCYCTFYYGQKKGR